MRGSIIKVILLAVSLGCYIWLGYFTVRTNFNQVVLLYFALFGLYFAALRLHLFGGGWKRLLAAAILLRICLLFMIPNLSDDYFRFIWDGLFTAAGQNPYLVMPSTYMAGAQAVPGITDYLFQHLNSQQYYTVYPPVCQAIFGFSARVCGADIFWNVLMMRLFILLADLGTIMLLFKIARMLDFKPSSVAVYAFNPLVIMELTGNLHFEAVMLFFLALAVYLLAINRWPYSASSYGLSAGAKLVPLIFLPLLVRRLGWRRSLAYFAITGLVLILIFIPFMNLQLAANLASSLGLYFQKFEFNASVYYLARWLGYLLTGYNTIAILGVALPLFSLALIILIAAREKKPAWETFFTGMLLCGTAYYLLATTVHPWYIATLVLASAFSRYRYALIWSMLIVLSYSAYGSVPYTENLWLVVLEYVVVLGWMGYEFLVQPRLKATATPQLRP